ENTPYRVERLVARQSFAHQSLNGFRGGRFIPQSHLVLHDQVEDRMYPFVGQLDLQTTVCGADQAKALLLAGLAPGCGVGRGFGIVSSEHESVTVGDEGLRWGATDAPAPRRVPAAATVIRQQGCPRDGYRARGRARARHGAGRPAGADPGRAILSC